ncbi:hypothetical protein [Flavobacterium columnare]|uniref:hypothetical protein n=1 Tax=Flavobacterium TaxID=237 RepID=UPI000B5B9F2A|nr:hypothetical protein [Flavobacterium columnare]OXA73356.1 hypothetical protein B0A56_13310 [Flavobacterium columnare NBRC 100251 = ATCC 23463]
MNNKIEQIQHKISYLMGITSLGFELNSFEDYFAIFLKPKNDISYKIVFSLFPVNDRVFFTRSLGFTQSKSKRLVFNATVSSQLPEV